LLTRYWEDGAYSRIIEDVKRVFRISVAFFYRAENDPARGSLIAVARGVLDQLLA